MKKGKIAKLIYSRKYHSALISTYTLDPVFANCQFIPMLKQKGIRNINVICDKSRYAKLLSDRDSLIELRKTQYLLISSGQDRLFHPKIILLIGEKEGLCLIGSGNLTFPGMGGNDEVWGAFHVTKDETQNASIITKVWKFLQSNIPEGLLTGQQKSNEWVLESATWLKELLEMDVGVQDEKSLFLNEPKSSIWDQVSARLIDKKLTEITVISPFYDKNGLLLKHIQKKFPNAEIRMVYDKFGQLPVIDEVIPKIKCYCWQDVTKQSNHRLHAKIFLFKEANGKEYCLFGSANATKAGLGLKSAASINVEASMFVSGSSGKFSENLGVDLMDVEPCSLQDLPESLTDSDEPTFSKRRATVITYAEQQNHELVLSVGEQSLNSSIRLELYDKNLDKVKEIQIQVTHTNTIRIAVENKIQYLTSEDENINCKQWVFVNSMNKLYASNPSSKYELISSTIGKLEIGDLTSLSENFSQLLSEFLAGRDSNQSVKSSSGSLKQTKSTSESNEFYHKDELRHKNSTVSISGQDVHADYIQSMLTALFNEKKRSEYSDPSLDSGNNDNVKKGNTNKANEEDVDESESEEPINTDEVQKQLNGYYAYFKKVIRYYGSFWDKINKELDDLKKNKDRNIDKGEFYRQKCDKVLILLWSLNLSLAYKVIVEFISKEIKMDMGNKSKPFLSGRQVSVDDIITSLLPKMIGVLRIGKIEINNYMDLESRLNSVSNIVVLLNLKHWPKGKKGVYDKLHNGLIEVFDLQNPVHQKKLREKVLESSQFFLNADFREYDVYSYIDYRKNLKRAVY